MSAPAGVTAVIATTGRPELERAVNSVVAQAGRPRTLVILDRPARLAEVRRRLKGLDCTVVATSGSVGSSAARNRGVSLVDGRFVAFCDDDDWWEPGKLSGQLDIARLAPDPDQVIVSCPMTFHRRSGQIELLPRRARSAGETVGDYVVSRPRLRFGDGIMQTSCLLMSTELARRDPWDESLRLHEDWDLVMRIMRRPGTSLLSSAGPGTHVQQGSPGSLSSAPEWRDSWTWWERHAGYLSPRARADFLAVHILRPALGCRDPAGVALALRTLRTQLREGPPHAAAVMVAGLGVIGR